MKSHLPLVAMLLVSLAGNLACEVSPREPVYPNRWVRIQSSLRDDAELERVVDLVRRASQHGINGIAFSAGLDSLDLKPPDYFERLATLRALCSELGVDIVPSFWSAGYGGGILSHNRNLAAGLPVKDAPFRASKGRSTLVADPRLRMVNGGFEEFTGGELTGFRTALRVGATIFKDDEVFKEGRASLRFENFGEQPEEAFKISQVVQVHPYRHYRIRGWVRAEGLDADDPFGSGNFRIEVLGGEDARRLQFENPRYRQDGEWHQVAVAFNSWGYDSVEIVPTIGDTRNGRLWLDDFQVEEIALINLLRRPGTPLVVRSASRDMVFEEGRDFGPVVDPVMDGRVNREGATLELLPGSRIRDGEELLVSYYHGSLIYRSQIPICMSEPEVYEIWSTQARLVHEALAPRKYLLNMDEVRVGGSCQACKSRGLSNAQILGDSVTRQYQILKGVNPEAEVFIWSDMLDPNHNARPDRPFYYLAEETFIGSWEYVPRDLIIVCWYFDIREKSLQHFSGLGFRTMAGAYYDADDLENCKEWLVSLDRTEGACGIMYTTWLNKYELMESFGDLASRR